MSSNLATVGRSYSSPSEATEPPVVGSASDWVGFIVFTALAAWTLRRMPAVGVFLLPTIAHELVSAVGFLIRDRARATCRTLTAQLAAYGSTFLLFAFFHIVRLLRPEWFAPTNYQTVGAAGLLMWLCGSAVSISAMWALRYAMSIEPQARRMIRTGPYRHVRHPIYLGYVLQYGGILLMYPTRAFAIAIMLWLAITVARIRYEERVLASAFPEYQTYRLSTGALFPLMLRHAKRRRHSEAATVATI
jgi:protein-S-isoprenylcysteine O-methyltransferase Ste14